MFSLRADVPGRCRVETPPQRTRCSFCGISALSQLGPDLLEGDRGKPPNGVRRQPVALIDVLAVPATGERLDDPGCFPAMAGERLVEFERARRRPRSARRTDVARELTAEVVVQAALCEAREERVRERTLNRSPPARRPIAR